MESRGTAQFAVLCAQKKADPGKVGFEWGW